MQISQRNSWRPACNTASSLLSLGESALAEAALARAEDWLSQLAPGKQRDIVTVAFEDTRADLLELLQRYDEANEIRQWTLERRSYSMVGLVTAASVHEAELAYFDQLLSSPSEHKPERAPLKTSLRLEPAPQDGLFPASGV